MPQESGPNNYCWNDWPYKCRSHKGFRVVFRKSFEIYDHQIVRNALKLPIILSLCYIISDFNSFTIPSGGPFWLLGRVLCTSRTLPPAYGPKLKVASAERSFHKVGVAKKPASALYIQTEFFFAFPGLGMASNAPPFLKFLKNYRRYRRETYTTN